MKPINSLKVGLFFCLICIFATSCYDGMLDYEQTGTVANKGGTDSISSADLGVLYLREAQMRVIDTREHKYQFQFNLHIDDYAGYMSISHDFESKMASSFAFNDGFAGGPQESYTWVVQQVVPVMNSADKLDIKPLGAMATILFAYASHQFSSVHGAIPYKDYRVLKETHPLTYDKLSDVYTWIFDDLDRAIDSLKIYKAKRNSEIDFLIEQTDMISGTRGAAEIIDQWLRFANSLYLRMAMNIVKVDNYTYKGMNPQQLAEKAVAGGVLREGDPTIGVRPGEVTGIGNHPLFKISKSWLDTRLNASLENTLKRTKNPLLTRWFNKNLGNLRDSNGKLVLSKDEKYIGMRSGTYLRNRSYDQDYKLFSDLSDFVMKDPIALFKVEEVLFLQAEGALRGWNMGGNVDGFYNAGIRESFIKSGLSDEDYNTYMQFRGMGDVGTSESDKQNAIYNDYYDADNNLPKWDGYYMLNNAYEAIDTNPYSSADNEKENKLQKIITQKWMAIFPMSLVAWTDYRRTGYPKILPACDFAYGDADGSISEDVIDWSTGRTIAKGLYIRRMPYHTGGDINIINEINATALKALGEGVIQLPDEQGTRLWWDIDKPNF